MILNILVDKLIEMLSYRAVLGRDKCNYHWRVLYIKSKFYTYHFLTIDKKGKKNWVTCSGKMTKHQHWILKLVGAWIVASKSFFSSSSVILSCNFILRIKTFNSATLINCVSNIHWFKLLLISLRFRNLVFNFIEKLSLTVGIFYVKQRSPRIVP